MGFSEEYIRQLYVEKIAGVISESDDEKLSRLLETDERAKRVWQDLENDSNGSGLDDFRATLRPEQALQQVKAAQRPERNAIRRSVVWSATAAAVVLIGIFFMQRLDREEGPLHFPVLAEAQGGIRLVTDDGQTVELGPQSHSGSIAIGNLEVTVAADGLQAVNADEVVMSRVIVPMKLTYHVMLPDGSAVWLNSGSELRFPSVFEGSTREVSLVGEGFFDIVTDPGKPFVVHAANTSVRVFGTRFNVNSYLPDRVQTALLEGSIRVSVSDTQHSLLQPGFALTYDGSGFRQWPFDPTVVTAWMEGVYYFQNASLDELAPVINRWYGLSVTLEDANLTKHRMTGLLERQDIAYFLADLKSATGIDHRYEAGLLVFHK